MSIEAWEILGVLVYEPEAGLQWSSWEGPWPNAWGKGPPSGPRPIPQTCVGILWLANGHGAGSAGPTTNLLCFQWPACLACCCLTATADRWAYVNPLIEVPRHWPEKGAMVFAFAIETHHRCWVRVRSGLTHWADVESLGEGVNHQMFDSVESPVCPARTSEHDNREIGLGISWIMSRVWDCWRGNRIHQCLTPGKNQLTNDCPNSLTDYVVSTRYCLRPCFTLDDNCRCLSMHLQNIWWIVISRFVGEQSVVVVPYQPPLKAILAGKLLWALMFSHCEASWLRRFGWCLMVHDAYRV